MSELNRDPGRVARAALLAAASLALLAALPPLLAPVTGTIARSEPGPGPLPEEGPIAVLTGPPIIAIQAGHWEVTELPLELAKLRTSRGASFGALMEVEFNRSVAASLVSMVEARGWKALLLPATVPPGLRAEAFVAIHADWLGP